MERYRKYYKTFPLHATLGDKGNKLHQNSQNEIIKQALNIWCKIVKKSLRKTWREMPKY
jgi:hypothetical protein